MKIILFLAHNQAKAGELGAIESILKAISVHKSDETVCEWGFIALGNMTLQSIKNEIVN